MPTVSKSTDADTPATIGAGAFAVGAPGVAHAQAVLHASIDAVVAIDHAGAITHFNPAAERIFGWPAATVLGREMAAVVVPPALRERHRQGMAR